MSQDQLVFRPEGRDVLVAPSQCASVAVPGLLQDVAARCQQPRPPLLVVDLTEVVGWSMEVLAPLVWARRQCRAAGGDLALVLPRHAVFAATEVAVLEQLFVVACDVPTARERLASSSVPAPRRPRS